MSNPEIDEIVASVQAAISRAYAIGRLDALKHVIIVMEAEETGTAGAKPLALKGPTPSEAATPPAAAPGYDAAGERAPSHQDFPANDDRARTAAEKADRLPWYRRTAN